MPRENAAAKARRYLAEGRVMLVRVTEKRVIHSASRVTDVGAKVRGESGQYHVWHQKASSTAHRLDGWNCDCEARSDKCAHILAVQLVTEPR